LSTFTPEQLELLDSFVDHVLKERLVNEIQKMIFDRHFYARFLKGHNFDIMKATLQIKNYLAWRKA
jgi:hypothetical protein